MTAQAAEGNTEAQRSQRTAQSHTARCPAGPEGSPGPTVLLPPTAAQPGVGGQARPRSFPFLCSLLSKVQVGSITKPCCEPWEREEEGWGEERPSCDLSPQTEVKLRPGASHTEAQPGALGAAPGNGRRPGALLGEGRAAADPSPPLSGPVALPHVGRQEGSDKSQHLSPEHGLRGDARDP